MSEPIAVGLAAQHLEQLANRVYVAMLRRRRWAVNEIAAQVAGPPEDVARAVDLLLDRGLIAEAQQGALRAQPPSIALRRLAAGHEQMAMRTRSMMPALAGIYEEARRVPRGTADPVVRSVAPGTDAVAAIESLIGTADTEVWSIWRTGVTAQAIEARSIESGRAQSPSGLPYPPQRILVESRLGESARLSLEGRDDVADMQVRHLLETPLTAVVTDRHGVFVELEADDGSIHALVSQDVALVDGVLRVIKALWESAETVSARAPGRTESLDQRVLMLLGEGASDRAIARQLDVSVRTVERRVRRILDDLGASTRFAAGAEAARRGLL